MGKRNDDREPIWTAISLRYAAYIALRLRKLMESISKPPSPVVVLGMHRSGTTLVTRLLEKMGVFMGWRKDNNHEALFFQGLNDWLLMQSGGSWDFPEPFHVFLRDADLRPLAVDYLRLVCRSPQAFSYLGPVRALKHLRVANLSEKWGWKDPRNTITLPLWLDMFPHARLIHVVRHGVDVARSLEMRRKRNLAALIDRYRRLRVLHGLILKRTRFGESSRCASLSDSFALWRDYMLWADASLSGHGAAVLELRYESLLAEPVSHVERLASFVGVDCPFHIIPDLVSAFVEARGMAYKTDPDLLDFAERHQDQLARFGY